MRAVAGHVLRVTPSFPCSSTFEPAVRYGDITDATNSINSVKTVKLLLAKVGGYERWSLRVL